MKFLSAFFIVVLFASPAIAKTKRKSKASSGENCLELGQQGSIAGVPGPKGWDLKQKCCAGLKDRTTLATCDTPAGGAYNYTCLACGDGMCDAKLESKCNCTEDCK